ncbi:MAG: YbdK family carboxylate-amine ligase [Planctomycetaceae bacterium]
MPKLEFTPNYAPTIGVELELQLVDQRTFALVPAIEEIMQCVPEELEHRIKPELMQSYLEINTDVCRTVKDVGNDLRRVLDVVEGITDGLGLKLFWGATHPFSSWMDQKITVNDRYQRLVELMQDVARQLVTFGLHVHVGVDTGDKAVMICDRMLKHLPLLLAISSNSPFWEGRRTGLHSSRSKVMEGLPTAGLPRQMRNWSEYTWLINHLVDTGFINTIREIWWDIRPHHNFGTVEIRVCDIPANLEQVLAITAVVQCLVQSISNEIDEGTYHSEYHPMMVQQNKWRATRFGPEARLVSTQDYKQYSVQQTVDHLIQLLLPMAEMLECADELRSATWLPKTAGSTQLLALFDKTNDHAASIKRMIEQNNWRQF